MHTLNFNGNLPDEVREFRWAPGPICPGQNTHRRSTSGDSPLTPVGRPGSKIPSEDSRFSRQASWAPARVSRSQNCEGVDWGAPEQGQAMGRVSEDKGDSGPFGPETTRFYIQGNQAYAVRLRMSTSVASQSRDYSLGDSCLFNADRKGLITPSSAIQFSHAQTPMKLSMQHTYATRLMSYSERGARPTVARVIFRAPRGDSVAITPHARKPGHPARVPVSNPV